jgi:hypothetical protein
VKVGKNSPTNVLNNITKLFQENKDIFAWIAADTPGVDPNFCFRHLAVRQDAKPMAQKKRRMGPERTVDIKA